MARRSPTGGEGRSLLISSGVVKEQNAASALSHFALGAGRRSAIGVFATPGTTGLFALAIRLLANKINNGKNLQNALQIWGVPVSAP